MIGSATKIADLEPPALPTTHVVTILDAFAPQVYCHPFRNALFPLCYGRTSVLYKRARRSAETSPLGIQTSVLTFEAFMSTITQFLAASAAASVVLGRYAPEYTLGQSYLLTAIAFFFGQFFVWATYKVVIYPKFLSPLRNLPQPSVSTNVIERFTIRC